MWIRPRPIGVELTPSHVCVAVVRVWSLEAVPLYSVICRMYLPSLSTQTKVTCSHTTNGMWSGRDVHAVVASRYPGPRARSRKKTGSIGENSSREIVMNRLYPVKWRCAAPLRLASWPGRVSPQDEALLSVSAPGHSLREPPWRLLIQQPTVGSS